MKRRHPDYWMSPALFLMFLFVPCLVIKEIETVSNLLFNTAAQ
ncbi:hypothetical protein JOC95_003101 [Bacillus tianshenii]|uniref:Uncharacterized protein n=1 Tax=Sutcliffiella tianshenii TaxID=1463404 RepID=A0ABS2P2Q5_9BACI|nr:hypothetical protein [Bacillus tianshenii]